MTPEQVEARRREIVERLGPWTAHNVRLAGDVYTMAPGIAGDEIKLRRIVQTVADLSGRPLAELRVLDLACLEGLYAVEFARHGARVVGVEGRAVNLAKASFAKDVLALGNLELRQDDVRNLSRERYGSFDVVLCLGILYHLDAPDLFAFLERIGEVCQRFAVIDTHVSLAPEEVRLHGGREYRGQSYVEHAPQATSEEKAGRLWASLDNPTSFWLTRASLYNALLHSGFTSVLECQLPPEPAKPDDRVTLVAIKGQRHKLACAPLADALPLEVPEAG